MNHAQVVLALYRHALRRALCVDADEVHTVRVLFRKRRTVTNALLLQEFMREAVAPQKVGKVEKVEKVERVRPTPPRVATPPLPKTFRRRLNAEEQAEFSATTVTAPTVLLNAPVHHKWWSLAECAQWAPKSRLHRGYALSLLPSLVRHAKASRALARVRAKLASTNTGTHKLRRINGTSTWLYVVNTPWNGSLRTRSADLAQILHLRRRYDALLCEEQLLAQHRDRYEVGASKGEYFTQYEQHVRRELAHVHAQTIEFAKKQGVLYARARPLFERDREACRARMAALERARDTGGDTGSHLDVLGRGLARVADEYGF